ncbi:MAG: biotin--[acetyl-CoA-carboxylase] ligase [Bacillota bacterium]
MNKLQNLARLRLNFTTNGLKTKWLGKNLYYYQTVDSTNEVAKAYIDIGQEEGTVIIADYQTAGRGRLGRKWESPEGGGLWFSVIFKPPFELKYFPQVNLLAAVAVVEAVKKRTGIALGIKWPNDLLLNHCKVCGILAETYFNKEEVNYLILGVGLNVNVSEDDLSQEIRLSSTSINTALKKYIQREPLFSEILYCLENWYETFIGSGISAVRRAWLENNITLGRWVEIRSFGEVFHGKAVDISMDGNLLVEGERGEIKSFVTGDVSLRVID